MSNFEKFTVTPEVMGEFLASLTVANGPWDEEFHRTFCDGCKDHIKQFEAEVEKIELEDA